MIGFIPFTSLKANVIARLKFELDYNYVAVQHVSQYTTGILPFRSEVTHRLFNQAAGNTRLHGTSSNYMTQLGFKNVDPMISFCNRMLEQMWLFKPASVLKYVQIPYLPNPSAWAGYDTRSIFKRSLTGLNSEFSFS